MIFTNLSNTPEAAPLGTFGLVNVLTAICVIPISYICAPLGVNIGKNIAPVTLKRVFAVALLIISVNMLYKGITHYTGLDGENTATGQVSVTSSQQS